MYEKYSRQMKKGIFDLLVLKLLEREQKYGYQLISELKDKSNDLFVLKEGTLYPILYRLEDDGLVKSSWSSPQGKQVARKYYQITDKGQTALLELSHIWEKMSSGIVRIMTE